MKHHLIFFIILVGTLFTSCLKDVDDFKPYPGNQLKQRLLFIVKDVDGQALAGVEITLGDRIFVTDKNGVAYVHETLVQYGLNQVKFKKSGYFYHIHTVNFTEQEGSRTIRVEMAQLNTGNMLHTDVPQEITFNNIELLIPAHSLIDKAGKAYNGNYFLAFNFIPPDKPELYKSHLGYTTGVRSNGTVVAFENFGQFQIAVLDAQRNPLYLKSDSSILVEYIPSSDLYQRITASVPVWEIDYFSGIWKEYGRSNLEGNKLTLEIKELGSFMLAMAFPTVKLHGKIVTDKGFNFTTEYLNIVNFEGTYHSIPIETDGTFSLTLPQNEDFTIQLMDACGNQIGEEDVAPFPVETDIGMLDFQYTPQYQLRATTTDCFNNPDNNGYFRINTGNKNAFYYMSNTPDINIHWESCSTLQFEDAIITYFKKDGTTRRFLYDELLHENIGGLNTCDKIIEHSWYIIIDHKKRKVQDIRVTDNPENVVIKGNLPAGEINITFREVGNSVSINTSPYDISEPEESYFLLEKSRESIHLSFKVKYKKSTGQEALMYGRVQYKR